MKLIFMLLVVFVSLEHCFAQPSEKIAVTVLKESQKIDSLMDIVFAQEKLSAKNNAALLKDSCWRIEMRNLKTYISFQVVKNQTFVVNTMVNRLKSFKDKRGCFKYKGYKIFVWTEDDFHDLFNKTTELETFDFIYTLDANVPFPTQDQLFPNIFHYKYADGHFSVEGPPSVKL